MAFGRHKAPSGPLRAATPCTLRFGWKPTSANAWSNFAGTSRGQRFPTSGSKSKPPIELKLKTPWRDGTTHLVMSPMEFMHRLAALVPRPRLHLIRFHDVLEPNAKLRAQVVPHGPEVEKRLTEAAPAEDAPATEREAEPGDKQFGDQSVPVPGDAPGLPGVLNGAACTAEPVQGRSHRLAWARLLWRVSDIEMQRFPNCGGGELKIIAALLERPLIEKIFTHWDWMRSRRPQAGRESRGRGGIKRADSGRLPVGTMPPASEAKGSRAASLGSAALRASTASYESAGGHFMVLRTGLGPGLRSGLGSDGVVKFPIATRSPVAPLTPAVSG